LFRYFNTLTEVGRKFADAALVSRPWAAGHRQSWQSVAKLRVATRRAAEAQELFIDLP
jgi:hypothetical protein